MNRSIFSLLIFAAVIAVLFVNVDAQCASALDPQNVCLYGTTSLSGSGGNMQQQSCQIVNENPFAYTSSGTNCEAAVRNDGSACVQFYAKYLCSGVCPKCNLPLCNSYCDNYEEVCPTAAANGCFRGISCSGVSPPTCVDWSVDVSKIPAATTTTTHRVTTTTTTTRAPTTTTTERGTGTTRDVTTTTLDDFTSPASIQNNQAALIVLAIGALITFTINYRI